MKNIQNMIKTLDSPSVKKLFEQLYGGQAGIVDNQIDRYTEILKKFQELFGDMDDLQLFSTPGRTEIGGNHTDHNAGRVLAAGVSLDSAAAASRTDDYAITVFSRGYPEPFIVDLEDTGINDDEKGTTTALIRGIAARFVELGYRTGGFKAYISSDVLGGSGLSSSASIEVLIATIMNWLYNNGTINEQVLAGIGQYAENAYFGKPSGLMDQMACAVGGFITIDFKDSQNPIVRKIDFDFAAQYYNLLVVNTGGNHADLTPDYAAVPAEMKAVARAMGADVCRDLTMDQIIGKIAGLRKLVSDRAILRAMHFLTDDLRVVKEVEALERNDFDAFLKLVTESGNSSWKWLQNCFTVQNPEEQGITLALAVTENFIERKGSGACRVHGGGFAGTIQVFLPVDYTQDYIRLMESIFGDNAVTVLNIRPKGTININSLI